MRLARHAVILSLLSAGLAPSALVGCGQSENDAALKSGGPGQPATDVPASQEEYDKKFQNSGLEPAAEPAKPKTP